MLLEVQKFLSEQLSVKIVPRYVSIFSFSCEYPILEF